MAKTILITGATDGIGLATAEALARDGHALMIHGRNPEKLEKAQASLSALPGAGRVSAHRADLSRLAEVDRLAEEILSGGEMPDVVINNAGVLKTPAPATADGLDARFAVNTLAPYRLTRRLLPRLAAEARVVNIASAAQAPVTPAAIGRPPHLSEMEAYSQSKLALIMWTRHLTGELGSEGPMMVSVNPGSLLASKMVKQGFGIQGNDIGIGVDILCRAALSAEFAQAHGRYFDNDAGRFGDPHPDALNPARIAAVMEAIHACLAAHLPG